MSQGLRYFNINLQFINFKIWKLKVCRKHTSTGMVYFNDLSDLKKLEKALIDLKRNNTDSNQENENNENNEGVSIKKLKV
jgi:hypothetical protein